MFDVTRSDRSDSPVCIDTKMKINDVPTPPPPQHIKAANLSYFVEFEFFADSLYLKCIYYCWCVKSSTVQGAQEVRGLSKNKFF